MREPRDPLTLDPETWVAAEILRGQTPRPGTELPGMTPYPEGRRNEFSLNLGKFTIISTGTSLRRLRIAKHHIGSGPTCSNCNCGRKETE